MAHKTLTISEDAYRVLASIKRTGESFTDVILRIGRVVKKRPLEDFAGRLADERFEDATREIRRAGLDLKRLEKAVR